MIGAVPCTVSALSLIPLSLAAPFSGLTIIFSLLLAATGVLTERELLSPTEVGCTVLVLCGVSMVALFGPQSSGEAPPDVVLERFESAETVHGTAPIMQPKPSIHRHRLKSGRSCSQSCDAFMATRPHAEIRQDRETMKMPRSTSPVDAAAEAATAGGAPHGSSSVHGISGTFAWRARKNCALAVRVSIDAIPRALSSSSARNCAVAGRVSLSTLDAIQTAISIERGAAARAWRRYDSATRAPAASRRR